MIGWLINVTLLQQEQVQSGEQVSSESGLSEQPSFAAIEMVSLLVFTTCSSAQGLMAKMKK